jgi:hypothetical protein
MASEINITTLDSILSMPQEGLRELKSSIIDGSKILTEVGACSFAIPGLPRVEQLKQMLVKTPTLLSADKVDEISSRTLSSVEVTSKPVKSDIIKENNRKIQELLDEVAEREIDPQRLSLAVAEILSKGLAYSRTLDNKEIEYHFEIPQIIEGRVVKMHYVASAWDLGNSNLAYVLEPYASLHRGKEAKCGTPFVVFRGTCPHEFGTVRSSFGSLGVISLLTNNTIGFGNIVINENRQIFKRLIAELYEQHGVKPLVCGHSLGGALAQRLSVLDGNLSGVSGVIAFNSPGVLREDEKLYEAHILANPTDDNKVISIATDKDPVNHLGFDSFLGKKYLFKPDFKIESSAGCHGQIILTKAGKLQECSKSVISLAQKVLEIALFPIRFAFVSILVTLAFICVDIIGMTLFLLTSEEVGRRRMVKRVSIDSDKSLLDQIRDRSPVFWSVESPKIRSIKA